ncbi:hemolytic protein HlpA [Spirosoma harenae]
MLATPILLLVFNRPGIAQKSFEQIRKVKPRQLFIAADGPRPNKPGDIEACAATREIINQIDWPCDLKTLFRNENRGCGRGPAEAISWFFAHVEQGIILEDDCLAHTSFFTFCEELLETYRSDTSISMISGTNPVVNWKFSRNSYLFSNVGFSWGWASWRRAWLHFDYTASQWATPAGKEKVRKQLTSDALYNHFSREFDYYFKDVRNDVWDFQWLFSRLFEGTYSIIPTVNLITNIGYDENATHTFDPGMGIGILPTISLKFPLKHPDSQKIDNYFDWYVFERFVNPEKRSLAKKTVLKLIKTIISRNVA